MKNLIFAVMLVIVGSVASAESVATQTLEGIIKNRILVCYSKARMGRIAVRIANSQILISAKDDRRAKYWVYGAKINQTNLVIALQNDVDGPLATDVMVLPIVPLQQLARQQVSSVQAFIASREGYNGTHENRPMNCVLNQ